LISDCRTIAYYKVNERAEAGIREGDGFGPAEVGEGQDEDIFDQLVLF
jgi:hypothetical protein